VKQKKIHSKPPGRNILLRFWPLFAAAALVVAVAGALIFSQPPAEEGDPNKYDFAPAGSEVDFYAPELPVHTAEDGIAVVTPPPAAEARPAQSVSDPAEIWQGDTTATHSGFTMPVAMDGDSIGVLTIPDIDLSVRVYETGDDMADMERGAAHFKSTSAFEGNIGLSAHNVALDGSAGYFLNLHTLTPGAAIQYETALGSREYAVESVTEISEMDWTPLERTEDNRITLITCITGKPELRLCVTGIEVDA
jgi:LPXTG-site transpeptidase (sortase) family protein